MRSHFQAPNQIWRPNFFLQIALKLRGLVPFHERRVGHPLVRFRRVGRSLSAGLTSRAELALFATTFPASHFLAALQEYLQRAMSRL